MFFTRIFASWIWCGFGARLRQNWLSAFLGWTSLNSFWKIVPLREKNAKTFTFHFKKPPQNILRYVTGEHCPSFRAIFHIFVKFGNLKISRFSQNSGIFHWEKATCSGKWSQITQNDRIAPRTGQKRPNWVQQRQKGESRSWKNVNPENYQKYKVQK